MDKASKFLFDLNGFIVIRNVLTQQEVQQANHAIDANMGDLKERVGESLRNSKPATVFSGDGTTGRKDLAGFLGWPGDQSQVFRKILSHPKMVPIYNDLLGAGYRLDHSPLIITQETGADGFSLHGGPLTSAGEFEPTLQYRCVNGKMWNSLLAVSVVLTDHNPGDGGFCVLRGSHKLNFPVPPEFENGVSSEFKEHIHQPVTRAGDVVLFSECTVHGCLPWTADIQRRIALYRLAPANMAYGRAYSPAWPQSYTEGMTPAQQAVMTPPFATRLDRPLLDAGGGSADGEDGNVTVAMCSRSDVKKSFDKDVFKGQYF